MRLTGLHLLLTYQCTLECDHCFVWGSPWQPGTMTAEMVDEILRQARDLGSVESIYFEGGEPFLYYATLVASVRRAHAAGYSVGIVTNAYWATSVADAVECLRPFVGLVADLTISTDLYHSGEARGQQARNALAAAAELGLPTGAISVAQPQATGATVTGQLPAGECGVMYRGRAVEKLAHLAPPRPWSEFTTCPHEDLRDPGRVHVDPLGYVHLCQGIVLGNLLQAPLVSLVAGYDPDSHPIAGPLLGGGPVELVTRHGLAHRDGYADACHLCYEARRALREQLPAILAPDQAYGLAMG
jgi:hypothetical protein